MSTQQSSTATEKPAGDPQKLSVMEKIGYSLGDLAANLIFQTLMAFLAFFYTDIYKIPPAKASFVMLVGGIIGACFNLVMGAIADRTNTRCGVSSWPMGLMDGNPVRHHFAARIFNTEF